MADMVQVSRRTVRQEIATLPADSIFSLWDKPEPGVEYWVEITYTDPYSDRPRTRRVRVF